jgi:hypothetical protein
MNNQAEELSLTIPKQHIPCFLAFLDIFKGLPFYFEKYSLESVSYLIRLFGISSLSHFISENFHSPQNIQEALEFLSIHSCELYSKIFNNSLDILIQHFSDIKPKQFLLVSNFVLETLLLSPQFQVDHEDILFNLIIDLIKRDPNRKGFLKVIYFPAVSSSLLIKYFTNVSVEKIDHDLFESIRTL